MGIWSNCGSLSAVKAMYFLQASFNTLLFAYTVWVYNIKCYIVIIKTNKYSILTSYDFHYRVHNCKCYIVIIIKNKYSILTSYNFHPLQKNLTMNIEQWVLTKPFISLILKTVFVIFSLLCTKTNKNHVDMKKYNKKYYKIN